MRVLALLAICGLLVIANDARAQDEAPSPAPAEAPQQEAASAPTASGPEILPYFNQGVASDEEVRRVVGSVSFSMDQCTPVHEYFHPHDERAVRATLSRIGDIESQPAVIETILRDAAHYAWDTCPIPYVELSGEPKGDFHYDVNKVLIVGPNGEPVASARLGGAGLDGTGDQGLWSSRHGYVWRDYVNGLAASREQAAQAQGQQEAAAVQAQQAEVRAEAGNRAMASFWGWVRFILFCVVAWFLFTTRETWIGWYYALKPHPARDMVESRIHGGGAIDGALFATIMKPVPGSRIEQRVRAEQAHRLATMAREAAEARLRELERMKAKALQEAEFIRAQAELHDAVEGHEMAMARLDAVRQWRKRNVR